MRADPVMGHPTKADYDRVFDAERRREYPTIDSFEARMGYAIDRGWLEGAARILACPVKANPPNWQHGRVIYAAAVKYCNKFWSSHLNFLDIGTAKGFSALCMRWAVDKSDGCLARIDSVDVIDPCAHVRRNTVAEIDGLKTLEEIVELVEPDRDGVFWPHQSTGVDFLKRSVDRIHFAFVDGKHSYDVASEESRLIAKRQQRDDVVIFDDIQIEGIWRAVRELRGYRIDFLAAMSARKYAICTRE